MTAIKDIKWALLLVAGLGTMVFLLLADVVFVTYYAQLVNPSQDQAFYNQFALDTAGPFIFCFAPFPIYIVTRWLCNKAGRDFFLHALLYFAAFYLIEFIMLAVMGTWEGLLLLSYWLNVASMLAGVLAGAYFATRAGRDIE
jgi:hypothetical protein